MFIQFGIYEEKYDKKCRKKPTQNRKNMVELTMELSSKDTFSYS